MYRENSKGKTEQPSHANMPGYTPSVLRGVGGNIVSSSPSSQQYAPVSSNTEQYAPVSSSTQQFAPVSSSFQQHSRPLLYSSTPNTRLSNPSTVSPYSGVTLDNTAPGTAGAWGRSETHLGATHLGLRTTPVLSGEAHIQTGSPRLINSSNTAPVPNSSLVHQNPSLNSGAINQPTSNPEPIHHQNLSKPQPMINSVDSLIGNASQNSSQGRSSGVLFSKEMSVLVRGRDGEKKQRLNISLQDKPNAHNHSKDIYLQVTDSQDPLLFYSLCITEEDFQFLKSNQGLLVDYSSFPGMVCQLLEKCVEHGDFSSPGFILIINLNIVQPSLEFTELNMFKHLCHLNLIIVKASDSQLKDYLVECIQQLQNEIQLSTTQLQQLQQQIFHQQKQLEQHSEQLTAAMREQRETSSSLGQKLLNDLQEEKDRCSQKITELQSRFESERREIETRHRRSMEQLENRVASLDVQNRDLLEAKYRGESSIREIKGNLVTREEEFTRVQAELQTITRDRAHIESRHREECRRRGELENRISVLEEEERTRDQEINKTRDLVDQIKQEKEDLVAQLQDKTGTVSRRESAVRSVTEELMKANQIIRKLQEQLKQEQNKANLRGKIAGEQEKLLNEKDQELGQVREELREALQGADEQKNQGLEKEKKVEELIEKNDQLEKINRSNENVINWLNKQLASFKSSEAIVASSRVGGAGRGKPGGRVGLSKKTSFEENNENEPIIGLDAKYFEHSTPGGSKARSQIPDVTNLPTNIKRGVNGGLLRR